MTTIAISQFAGENRAAEPKLLPEGQGVLSRNQKPGRGDLRGWREPLAVFSAPAGTQTMYRMGRDTPSDTQYWLAWPQVVHVARTFDVEDTTERTAYTGDGYPKVTDNLALSAANPTTNPQAHRPLGIPAPAAAPIASVAAAEADPDAGKYQVLYPASDVAQLSAGGTFRVTLDGRAPQVYTLPAGGTAAQQAAAVDALEGLRAYATASDDEYVPSGVRVVSDAVGVGFFFEALTGTAQNYDPGAVTLAPLLAVNGGGGGVNATLLAVDATAALNYALFVPEVSLSTLQAGDTLAVTVAGAQRVSVRVPGSSKAGIVQALRDAGLTTASAQDAVPYYDGGEGGGQYGPTGQPGGIRIPLGATSAGAPIVVLRNPPTAAAAVVTRAWLDANAQPGDRWQVVVGGAAPVSVTLSAGANTYPAAVTAASLKSALLSVPGLKLTEETDVGGAPQLRIESSSAGAASKIAISKIVPATGQVWGGHRAATVVAPKVREVDAYYYVYTYVNDWGWESAPSPVSDRIERTVKETCQIANFAAPPSGGYNVNRIRLYRTQAGSSGDADFFFLMEAPVASATLTDDNRDLGEVLPTKKWLTAPGVPRGGADNYTEPNLSWLTPMWNGMLAGITGKSVRFCEAHTPYAWPIDYDAVPPDQPVAQAVFGQNLLVLTTGRPFLVAGSSPDGLDQAPLEIPQGCIAPRSVVGMGNGVAWASNDGLCWYGEGGARVLTAGVMTREDWLALRPETIQGQMYEGLYFGSYQPVAGGPCQGFLVSPQGGGVFFLDEGFDAAYFDNLQDQLYLLRGTAILKWEAGAGVMSAQFRSKVYRQPKPVNLACAEVVATGYPVQFSLWADGVLKHQGAVADREPFRLPAGFLAMDWQVQVDTPEAEGGVQAVLLASSMRELAQL